MNENTEISEFLEYGENKVFKSIFKGIYDNLVILMDKHSLGGNFTKSRKIKGYDLSLSVKAEYYSFEIRYPFNNHRQYQYGGILTDLRLGGVKLYKKLSDEMIKMPESSKKHFQFKDLPEILVEIYTSFLKVMKNFTSTRERHQNFETTNHFYYDGYYIRLSLEGTRVNNDE